MAITTRASDPMFVAAAVTLVVDPAKFARSTTRDRADHLAMTKWYRVAKRFQVSRCVLPEAVRDGWHRLLGLPSKDPLDGLPCVDFGRFG